jgi:hypothetical protein
MSDRTRRGKHETEGGGDYSESWVDKHDDGTREKKNENAVTGQQESYKSGV